MTRLLRANLTRLLKSATFWIFFSLYVAYSLIIPIVTQSVFDKDTLAETSTQSILALGYGIIGIPIQGILIAITCCIIFGLDFHDRTARNKIILGHSRSQIYIANLLTASIISLAMSVVYLLLFLTISLPLFGKFTVPAKDIFILLLDGAMMLLAYSSVFTFISMTSKNPIVALLITIVLFIVTIIIVDFVCTDVLSSEADFIVNGSDLKVVYTSKAERGFCKFLLDFLPSGQSYQLANNNDFRWQMSLYSLVLIGATTGAGMLIFNKTNLK